MPKEQAQYDAHPSVAYDLLSKIPRLEPIAWMIEYQDRPAPRVRPLPNPGRAHGSENTAGDSGLRKTHPHRESRTEAAHLLSRQNTDFSPEFFQNLVALDPNAEDGEIRRCRIDELAPGMIIQQESATRDGYVAGLQRSGGYRDLHIQAQELSRPAGDCK